MPNQDWYDLSFDIYAICYIIFGLSLIWQWKKNEADRKNKIQANIIFYSFVVSFLIAGSIDLFSNIFLTLPMPQMAPIINLLPCCGIFYSILKYRFMNRKAVVEEEYILNEGNRVRIYRHLSTAFIAGGFLAFISQYIVSEHYEISQIFISSAILFLFGFCVKILQYVKMKEQVKNHLITFCMVISIPVITFQFISFQAVTIWAFHSYLLLFAYC